jgi:16S rRNA (uracil1498-N3)-methyltransferase
MRIPRIYTSMPLADNSLIELDTDSSHYISKVLRLREGDQLSVFNPEDGEYAAKVSGIARKTVQLQLAAAVACQSDPRLRIHLGLGMSRGERMDYAIQKATELGVSSISPLFTERCEVKLGEDRADKRLTHWSGIARSASEQSGRCTIPVIERPIKITDWLNHTHCKASFVLDHRGYLGFPVSSSAPQSVTLLIGPEGGLSDQEIVLATQSGFQQVRLGPRVLRTETAPVVALSLVQSLWGDF